MDFVGSNGFFLFLFFFHTVIGVFGIYRMKVRQTVDNPDSSFECLLIISFTFSKGIISIFFEFQSLFFQLVQLPLK